MPPEDVITSGVRLVAPMTSEPTTTEASATWSPTVSWRSATEPTGAEGVKADAELLVVDGGADAVDQVTQVGAGLGAEDEAAVGLHHASRASRR